MTVNNGVVAFRDGRQPACDPGFARNTISVKGITLFSVPMAKN